MPATGYKPPVPPKPKNILNNRTRSEINLSKSANRINPIGNSVPDLLVTVDDKRNLDSQSETELVDSSQLIPEARFKKNDCKQRSNHYQRFNRINQTNGKLATLPNNVKATTTTTIRIPTADSNLSLGCSTLQLVGPGSTGQSIDDHRYLTYGTTQQLQQEYNKFIIPWQTLTEFRLRRKLRRFKRRARKLLLNGSSNSLQLGRTLIHRVQHVRSLIRLAKQQNQQPVGPEEGQDDQLSRSSSLTSLLNLIEEANKNLLNSFQEEDIKLYEFANQMPPQCPPRLKRTMSSINFGLYNNAIESGSEVKKDKFIGNTDGNGNSEKIGTDNGDDGEKRVKTKGQKLQQASGPAMAIGTTKSMDRWTVDNYRIAFVEKNPAINNKNEPDTISVKSLDSYFGGTNNNSLLMVENGNGSKLPDGSDHDKNSKILCVRSHFQINDGTIYLEDSDWEMCSERSDQLSSLNSVVQQQQQQQQIGNINQNQGDQQDEGQLIECKDGTPTDGSPKTEQMTNGTGDNDSNGNKIKCLDDGKEINDNLEKNVTDQMIKSCTTTKATDEIKKKKKKKIKARAPPPPTIIKKEGEIVKVDETKSIERISNSNGLMDNRKQIKSSTLGNGSRFNRLFGLKLNNNKKKSSGSLDENVSMDSVKFLMEKFNMNQKQINNRSLDVEELIRKIVMEQKCLSDQNHSNNLLLLMMMLQQQQQQQQQLNELKLLQVMNVNKDNDDSTTNKLLGQLEKLLQRQKSTNDVDDCHDDKSSIKIESNAEVENKIKAKQIVNENSEQQQTFVNKIVLNDGDNRVDDNVSLEKNGTEVHREVESIQEPKHRTILQLKANSIQSRFGLIQSFRYQLEKKRNRIKMEKIKKDNSNVLINNNYNKMRHSTLSLANLSQLFPSTTNVTVNDQKTKTMVTLANTSSIEIKSNNDNAVKKSGTLRRLLFSGSKKKLEALMDISEPYPIGVESMVSVKQPNSNPNLRTLKRCSSEKNFRSIIRLNETKNYNGKLQRLVEEESADDENVIDYSYQNNSDNEYLNILKNYHYKNFITYYNDSLNIDKRKLPRRRSRRSRSSSLRRQNNILSSSTSVMTSTTNPSTSSSVTSLTSTSLESSNYPKKAGSRVRLIGKRSENVDLDQSSIRQPVVTFTLPKAAKTANWYSDYNDFGNESISDDDPNSFDSIDEDDQRSYLAPFSKLNERYFNRTKFLNERQKQILNGNQYYSPQYQRRRI